MSDVMTMQKAWRVCCFSLGMALSLGMVGSAMAQGAPQNLNAVMSKAFEQGKNDVRSVPEVGTAIAVPSMRKSQTASRVKGTMYLTPGKSQILTLAKDAASVVVGDTSYINVFLDTPRTAVIVPRSLGVTEFSIIGVDGSVIAHSRVMVSTETDGNYVRIHRVCGEGGGSSSGGCAEETIYYCEDNCVEVSGQAGRNE